LNHPGFFETAGPFSLRDIAEHTGSALPPNFDGAQQISGIRPLNTATVNDLAFLDNRRYADQLAVSKAGVCILSKGDAAAAPATTPLLIAKVPYIAFAHAMRLFYADALRSKVAKENQRIAGELIHRTAQIDEGAVVEPGAVIGREAIVGKGSVVSSGAVLGYRSVLGEDCHIGAGATVTHAILGNQVIIHPGVRIGQDGFGFAMSAQGHLKVPQIGCVRIDDDVEIGANSTVDRGTLSDTIISAGTKIDNLVQIGHNVIIGRSCIIVSQSGIAGSAELGDFVVMGACSGILGHVKVGSGAQIAGMAHVKDDVAAGARMGGTPARPFKEWARELAAIRKLARPTPK
jgi:UDP-3-O-[3-hydroxymyristoyl] glucosamine N-acyltransferase